MKSTAQKRHPRHVIICRLSPQLFTHTLCHKVMSAVRAFSGVPRAAAMDGRSMLEKKTW